jgi:hypothetical protein
VSSAEETLLALTISPEARPGETIEVKIKGSKVPLTKVELASPDTAVISQPHVEVIGSGTFERTIWWRVEHVQPGTIGWVTVTASAGHLRQWGQCKIVGN